MLGCLNNRHQQLKKVAKAVALKFSHGDKKKEETQQPIQQQKKVWGVNTSNTKTSEGPVRRVNNSL
jgi:hypothetical protein